MAISKASRSKRRSNSAQYADRTQNSASVTGITTAQDAGFIGEDAFENGSDQISLEPGYIEGNSRLRGVFSTDIDLLHDTEEVLRLQTDEENSKARKRGLVVAESPQSTPAEAISKKRKHRDQNKDLAPLESKLSRFQTRTHAVSPKPIIQGTNDATASSTESGDGGQTPSPPIGLIENELSISDAAEDSDGDWARAGGYHVSQREILRDEARDAKSKGRLIDADEEGAERDLLELQEALRIQAQARTLLTESDYIPADNILPLAAETSLPPTFIINPDLSIIPAALPISTREERIAQLLDNQPELLALLDDLGNVRDRLRRTRYYILGDNDKPRVGQSLATAFARLYCDLLSSYALNLSFFIHLKTYSRFPTMLTALSEQVTTQLVRLRSAISKVEDMDVFDLPGDQTRRSHFVASEGQGDLSDTDADSALGMMEALQELNNISVERHTSNSNPVASSLPVPRRKRRRRHSGRKQKDFVANDDDSGTLLKLENILPNSAMLTRAAGHVDRLQAAAGNDFVESENLSSVDAEEKGRRRNSLRFYTAKIEGQAARRADARRSRQGGDDDLPYRSKERARAAVLQRQQHISSDASPSRHAAESELIARELGKHPRGSGGSNTPSFSPTDTEYYDLVVSRKKVSNQEKSEQYAVTVQQDRDETSMHQSSDSSGPRAVNRQIMANKGLTPKRSKSVRNPRVKKRMRFEKAQQKSASMKPIYKRSAASGVYQGEKSGISSRVVKSRAL